MKLSWSPEAVWTSHTSGAWPQNRFYFHCGVSKPREAPLNIHDPQRFFLKEKSTRSLWKHASIFIIQTCAKLSPISVDVHVQYMHKLEWTCLCVLYSNLTNLQLRVGLTQAPVDVAVTVRLLKQRVQNLSHRLSLIHHHRLWAAIAHQHLYYQLWQAAPLVTSAFPLHGEVKCLKVIWVYLPHFGFLQLLQSQFNFVFLCLGFVLRT